MEDFDLLATEPYDGMGFDCPVCRVMLNAFGECDCPESYEDFDHEPIEDYSYDEFYPHYEC